MNPYGKIPGLYARQSLHHRVSGLSIVLGEKKPGSQVPMIVSFHWPDTEALDLDTLKRKSWNTKDRVERDRLHSIINKAESALRDRTPTVHWTAQVPGIDPLAAAEGSPKPEHVALDATSVVVVYDTRRSEYRIAAFKATDGKRLWDVAVPDEDPLTTVVLSPTHALVSRGGGLHAFDRTTGALAFTIR